MKKIITLIVVFVPLAVSAITPDMNLVGFVDSIIINVARPIAGLILALAIFYLIWNVSEVIRKSDQPEERAKLKSKVLWGLIAITVMSSLWGLVYIITNTLHWGTNTTETKIRVIGL